jgi:hypothetical protein
MEFFTAQDLDESMKNKIENYISKFKHKTFQQLIEKDWQSNYLICPFCRCQYEDYSLFLRHFRFYKHRWELKLLERIYQYGPRKLKVFDVFYKDKDLDIDLYNQVKLWTLSLKIFEALDIMPFWKNHEELQTRNYINRIFWEKDEKAKKNQDSSVKIP